MLPQGNSVQVRIYLMQVLTRQWWAEKGNREMRKDSEEGTEREA